MITIEQRLKRLEDAVFGKAGEKQKDKPDVKDYSGPTGGVRFLISKGFFKKKAALGEIRAALVEHDYHYSSQAVHEALKRLSGKGGPLVVLMEGEKRYVNRK
jgi:hypothetical protein